TNDLDIETLDLLEQLLIEYPGTVLLVSHDRAFLDTVVTQVIVADGDGRWSEHVGGWSDWAQWRANADRNTVQSPKGPSLPSANPEQIRAKNSEPAHTRSVQAKPKTRLTGTEQRELDQLPDRISALETEQTALTQRLSDPALHASQSSNLQSITSRLSVIEQSIAQLMERWELLESQRQS
ncbi:MAG: ABC transporter ATP-binding protein, partial [Betaproteobacteria bacterium]|nr:ABC transporter ATP-binding protein [Betaproteobacteria bacterium]